MLVHPAQPVDLAGKAAPGRHVDRRVHVAHDHRVGLVDVRDSAVWLDQDVAETAEWLALCSNDRDVEEGVACLGGECFGPAGQGFLRFSCAEPDDRLRDAVAFLKMAIGRKDRVAKYLEAHSKYRLK